MLVTRHFIVAGHVQGVGFRAATKARGQALGLAGWVRNLASGDVEVFAKGDASQVDKLADWLQHGPTSADVTSVQAESASESLESGFTVRY